MPESVVTDEKPKPYGKCRGRSAADVHPRRAQAAHDSSDAEQQLAMTVGMAATVMIAKVGEAAVSGVLACGHASTTSHQHSSRRSARAGACFCAQYLGRQDAPNARSAAKQLFYPRPALCAGHQHGAFDCAPAF
jgi:hypothetical protein